MYRWILREYVGEGNAYFMARGRGAPEGRFPPHTHDHFEIVWAESGVGIHLVNGQSRPFRAGGIVFVRPDDAHMLYSRKREILRICHLAFPVHTMATLEERYPGHWPNPFAFESPAQREFMLRGSRWEHFKWVVEELRAGARTEAALDWFLMNVAQLIRPMVHQSQTARWPAWLARVYKRLNEPDVLRGGTKMLCKLGGCSPQHLVRVIRKHLGETPTDLLNDARLHYAASRLIRSDDQIIAIAADCGLTNLGHFYELFRRKYGATPRRYRLFHRQNDG